MSIESRSRQYGKVFDHWQIKEFLGSGSGGKTAVFRLVRSDSTRGVSALKVVNLIEVRGDINSLSEFRRKEYETARDECSRSAEQEVWLMDDLRGNTNIVDYLDHTFVDWSDETGFGRDLLIRMELLKDLRSELQNGRAFSEREVLKIGSDICIALIRCHRKNILHRDIKPENIFRNKDGDYKLGDFGVSRVLDACPGAVASTGIGTYEYWPAEQMTGRYDKRVDIYSLGLVLYELCNQNRLPFAASTYVTGKEVSLRLAGTPLPEPIEASPALSEVILKACAFDPEERYQSAEELLRALNHVIRSLQKTAERKTSGIPISDVKKKTAYATVPAEVSEVETSGSQYKTIPARTDEQKKRTSFSMEPAKKKVYTTEPAEKHVPKYVTRTSGIRKKSKLPVIWIAVALLGLCMAIFSAGLLFPKSLETKNSGEQETILQSKTASEPTTQYTTIPEETIYLAATNETATMETAIIEAGDDDMLVVSEATDPKGLAPIISISLGENHISALRSDGTVSCTLLPSDVSDWVDIIAISAGNSHTVGLKSDGTVVATGANDNGQCNVSGWQDVVSISAGENFTAALTSDGTILSTKNDLCDMNYLYAQSGVATIEAGSGLGKQHIDFLTQDGKWTSYGRTGIREERSGSYTAISDGVIYSAGLKTDGTVRFIQDESYGILVDPPNTASWNDIIAVSADCHIVGLKSDGTVLATGGDNLHGRNNVSNWSNIIAISTNSCGTIGLRSDGTIMATGLISESDLEALNVNYEITTEQSGNVSTGKDSQYDVKDNNIDGNLIATVINTDSLKVRRSGFSYAEQIGRLSGGTTLAVWEHKNGWYKLDTNRNGVNDYNEDGWCSGDYLYIRESSVTDSKGDT